LKAETEPIKKEYAIDLGTSQKQCLDLIQQTQKSWTKQSHNSTFLHTQKQNKEDHHKFISSLQEQSLFKS
jgi:hypothetical protein